LIAKERSDDFLHSRDLARITRDLDGMRITTWMVLCSAYEVFEQLRLRSDRDEIPKTIGNQDEVYEDDGPPSGARYVVRFGLGCHDGLDKTWVGQRNGRQGRLVGDLRIGW
jgi:hypothetical protein